MCRAGSHSQSQDFCLSRGRSRQRSSPTNLGIRTLEGTAPAGSTNSIAQRWSWLGLRWEWEPSPTIPSSRTDCEVDFTAQLVLGTVSALMEEKIERRKRSSSSAPAGLALPLLITSAIRFYLLYYLYDLKEREKKNLKLVYQSILATVLMLFMCSIEWWIDDLVKVYVFNWISISGIWYHCSWTRQWLWWCWQSWNSW